MEHSQKLILIINTANISNIHEVETGQTTPSDHSAKQPEVTLEKKVLPTGNENTS